MGQQSFFAKDCVVYILGFVAYMSLLQLHYPAFIAQKQSFKQMNTTVFSKTCLWNQVVGYIWPSLLTCALEPCYSVWSWD